MIPRSTHSRYDRTRLRLTVLIVLASIGLIVAGSCHDMRPAVATMQGRP